MDPAGEPLVRDGRWLAVAEILTTKGATDAREDAGGDQPDLLAHLRGPGPHVRGCWAVDLLLGKS
jgi:hypothetical protein